MRIKFNSLLYKTNRFHVAVGLFSNRSQKTAKCGKNIVTHSAIASCATFLFLPNYHDILQNTNVWKDLRKFKITGSRLPALLGLHGQEKFIKYWKVVKQGLKESDVINTNFENFKRGHKFEKEAISVFCNLSNSETTYSRLCKHQTPTIIHKCIGKVSSYG